MTDIVAADPRFYDPVIVTADPHNWDCPTIDTDSFIKATLGDPLALPDSVDTKKWATDAEPALLRWFARQTCRQYRQEMRDNTYNSENDFSANFVFSVYVPDDAADGFYEDDTFVVIERHLGGDVRSNYGPLAVFRVDSLADTEFFDWTAGWYAEPLSNDADRRRSETLARWNDHLSVGYSSWPTGELRNALISKEPAWSDKLGAYIGRLEDVPFPVILRPISISV